MEQFGSASNYLGTGVHQINHPVVNDDTYTRSGLLEKPNGASKRQPKNNPTHPTKDTTETSEGTPMPVEKPQEEQLPRLRLLQQL